MTEGKHTVTGEGMEPQLDHDAALMRLRNGQLVLEDSIEVVPGQVVGVVLESVPEAGTSDPFDPGRGGSGAVQPCAGGMLDIPGQGGCFRVVGGGYRPFAGGWNRRVFFLEALCSLTLAAGRTSCRFTKQGFSLARVTLSDKGAAGLREDASGPVIEELVAGALEVGMVQRYLLPDDLDALRALLSFLCLEQGIDLVVTTGGTGLTLRDIAPEATLRLIDRRLPGIEQAMLAASLAATPHGALSRAVAGTLGQSLIINLPGSPKAVRENLAPVLPALEHALRKLKGDPSDCAKAATSLR